MKENSLYDKLSMRERQIMDILVRHEEASVHTVLKYIPDPPSYSSVRALLAVMIKKGYIRRFKDEKKFIYSPIVSLKEKEKKSMLIRLVDNFFEGSVPKAFSSILNFSSDRLSDKDFEELKKMIEQAQERKND